MSALASFKTPLPVSPGRLSELEITREISRISASGQDISATIDWISRLALRVPGVMRVQIEYADAVSGNSVEPLVWGAACAEDGVACAVAGIAAGNESWGELRIYFELHPSVL